MCSVLRKLHTQNAGNIQKHKQARDGLHCQIYRFHSFKKKCPDGSGKKLFFPLQIFCVLCRASCLYCSWGLRYFLVVVRKEHLMIKTNQAEKDFNSRASQTNTVDTL